jgi:hypothetical protein
MTTLGVIGSAGRGSDIGNLSPELYEEMCDIAAAEALEQGVSEAVSGGAAFADHAAVKLFLDGTVSSLRLYLPASFDGRRFVPDPRVPGNPGRVANDYHEQFRNVCHVEGLAQIAKAIEAGAVVETFRGFKRRNLEVAGRSRKLLAFTFGSKPSAVYLPGDAGFLDPVEAGLKDKGGTAHTWGECWNAERKRHVNLREIVERLGG